MKVKPIPVHHIAHIYAAYAKRLIATNSGYWGKYHNKIHNYYVYCRKLNDRGVMVTVEVLTYKLFRHVIEQYFDRAKTAIINGESLSVNSCGRICAKRIERDFSTGKKQVNWGRSNKFRKYSEEKGKLVYEKLIYHIEDDFCRIGWFKPGMRNETMYEFDPAARNSEGTSGFKFEFSDALNKDPLLKFRYPYFPIKGVAQE